MSFYLWLFLAAAVLAVLTGLSFVLLRLNARGRRFLALRTRAKLRFVRLLLADASVPFVAKAMLVIVAAYLAMPLDLIPDFIPIVGQADDIIVVAGAVGLLLWVVPGDRLDAALDGAEPETRP
jgi:uncharacterized membrane protein YkvA (DUF1232 family)